MGTETTKEAYSGRMNTYLHSPCMVMNIKAFCSHSEKKKGEEGGKEKSAPPPKAVHQAAPAPAGAKPHAAPAGTKQSAPPPKAGEHPGGHRAAQEEKGPAPLQAHQALPRSGAHPAGAHPVNPPRPLLLHVVPTAAEEAKGTAESHKVKVGRNSAEAGPVKVQGGTGEGDKVTLVADVAVKGNCVKEPHWVIKELDPRYGAPRQDVTLPGQTAEHSFLPPHVPLAGAWPFPFDKNILWLEGVHPRRYSVACKAPHIAPEAHHLLEVWAYPSNSSTLKLSTKAIKKPPWEKELDAAKEAFKSLFKHITDLAQVVKNAEIELLEGEVTLKNGWEEIPESNLARWKADLDADLKIIHVGLEFPISVFAFLEKVKKAEKALAAEKTAAAKLERWFKEKIGLYVEAELFVKVAVDLSVKGTASWEKEEDGHLSTHLGTITVTAGAQASLEARLAVGYEKAGHKDELAGVSGEASTEMTISTSPRLEAGPHLWLDNKFSWKPLHLKVTAKLNRPDTRADAPAPPPKAGGHAAHAPKPPAKKAAPAPDHAGKAAVDAAVKAPESKSIFSYEWSGDVLEEVKDRALPSIDLMTGAMQPHTFGKGQPVIPVVPKQAPPTKLVPSRPPPGQPAASPTKP